MGLQGAFEQQSVDCRDAVASLATLSVSAQPAATFAPQRIGSNVTKAAPSRPATGSSKNPFASMPREMRNNQLRNNLAAVAEQFKAINSGSTGAGGVSSPSGGSARSSGEFGVFPQQQGPFLASNGCQVSGPQVVPGQGGLRPLNQGVPARSPNSNSPSISYLNSGSVASHCSPSMLQGTVTPGVAFAPPPPYPQQQYLQYQNSMQHTYVPSSRSASLELQFGRSSMDVAAEDARRNSVDLTPYMVHQMQMQQMQQQPTYGHQMSAGGLHHQKQACSDPLPLFLQAYGGSNMSQPQHMVMSQPLMPGQQARCSSSDPTMFLPSRQQQPQLAMSASASLPPVTVALPVAHPDAAAAAAAQTERELQQLLFNQQVEQVVQQRLLQLSGEY